LKTAEHRSYFYREGSGLRVDTLFLRTYQPQRIGGRVEIGGVYLLTVARHGRYRMKGGGSAPPASQGWADFSIVMECTPESGRCHALCLLCGTYITYCACATCAMQKRHS
jgi:hypothetical protein